MNAISAIPVFHVKDIDAAVDFYTKVLGFTQSFRFGTYVGIRIGECEIHLCPPGDFGPRAGVGNTYVICDEVDNYYVRIKAAGAAPVCEPGDRMYGFRDFVVFDPDGNQLSFGCDIEEPNAVAPVAAAGKRK